MRDWLNRGPLMDGEPAPGGGGPPADPPAFDPAAFRAEITAMVNGGITRIEKQLKGLKPPAADPLPSPDPSTDPAVKPKDPETAKHARELEAIRKELATERTERVKATEQAREEKRRSEISKEMQKHGLADHAVDDAFRFFRDEVKYTEGGDLVGGPDELPLADFVKGVVEKRTHWLPPVPAGGAGATAGRGGKGASAITLDQIGPNMTKEQRTAAYAAINQALGR